MSTTDTALGEAEAGEQSQGGENAVSGKKFRRRIWIIDPQMQLRYMGYLFMVSGLIGAAGVAGAAYFFLFIVGGSPPDEDELREQIRLITPTLAVLAFFVVPIFSIFLSHRFAGPGYRLRKAAEQIAAGDLRSRIYLRRYDQLKPAAAAFNLMTDALEERESKRAEQAALACRSLDAALEKIGQGREEELPEILRLLEEASGRVKALGAGAANAAE